MCLCVCVYCPRSPLPPVANAPKNTTRKVQTLTELDQEAQFQVKGAAVSGAVCGRATECVTEL